MSCWKKTGSSLFGNIGGWFYFATNLAPYTQHAECDLNETKKPFNGTYVG